MPRRVLTLVTSWDVDVAQGLTCPILPRDLPRLKSSQRVVAAREARGKETLSDYAFVK